MRAAVHTKYGPPEVVRITDVPRPVPADHELLVRVRATTVNRTDCGYRGGHPFFIRFFSGWRRPRATILGNEFAGEVEAVGSAVTAFRVGDRVFGYNEGPFGAHAEYMTIAESGGVATIPGDLAFDVAAASTEGAHYALANIRAAQIAAGQDVLVNGATGAIGSAAVQLITHLGAHVTAVCGPEHAELVRGLGAERVIDYTTEDFTTDTQRFDAVFDAVGKSTFGRCRRVLKPGGVYMATDLGPLTQFNPLLALLRPVLAPLFGGRRVLFPLPGDTREAVLYLKGLIEAGHFTPLIDRRYPLEEIVEAYRYVESGQKVGNVVITVA